MAFEAATAAAETLLLLETFTTEAAADGDVPLPGDTLPPPPPPPFDCSDAKFAF